jgi:pimeloyl-ACP methyl ester carboxylesterase
MQMTLGHDLVCETISSADGIKLAVDFLGPKDAPVVVLMHGGGQTRHSWSGAMQALASSGYRVANYDARGHGESDWANGQEYSLADRVEDLRAVLANTPSPFSFVGASLGGATGILAAAVGLVPKALVVVDIVPQPEPEGISRITNFMRSNLDGFASVDEAADSVANYNPARPMPNDTSGLMRNLRRRDDGRLYWHWDPAILSLDPSEHHAIVQDAARTIGEKNLCPVMLVRGLSSDVVSEEGVADFRRLVPSLEVSDVSGAGHMVAGDRNDSFNEEVSKFLIRVMPPKGPR